MDDDDEYDLGEIMETQLHNDEDLDDPNPSRHNTASHHSTQHSSLLALPASHFTPRPPLPVIGLNNSGATCYLNSLLQSLYMTPEWRQGLYQLDEDDIGWQAWKDAEDAKAGKDRKEDDENEQAEQEIEVSEADVSELVSMGFEEDKVRLALKKYPSIDQREQAIDYIFTLPTPLPTTPSPPTATSSAASPSARPFRRIPCAFRLFFSQLQLYNHASMPTRLITSAFGWSDANLSVQHDIHELYTRLMEAMEGSLKGVSLLPSHLFSGQLTRTLTCESCGGSRSRLEDFYSLHLPVRPYPTIHHSLASVFAAESLTLSCDTCGGRQPTAAGSYISRLPLVLTFSLGRHEYDRLKGVRVKVGDEFAFPLVLDMAAYMAGVEETDKRRREEKVMASWPHKEQNGKHKSKPNTSDDFNGGEYSMLPSTFDSSSTSLYDLFAVIIHAGSAHSGHYFAYIRDVLSDGATAWYKCNDTNISAMDEHLIASQYGGKKESAYMLMYRHRTPQSIAPPVPTVPEELQEAAVEYNERLEDERRAWDEFRNAIKVTVWLDRAVELRGGLVVEREREERNEHELGRDNHKAKQSKQQAGKGGKSGKGKAAGGQSGRGTEEKTAKQKKQEEEEARQEDQRKARELAVAEDEQQQQEEDRKGKYSFVFDQRLTVEEMYERVRQRLRWHDEKEGGQLRLNRAEKVEENRDETGKRLEASLPYIGIQLRDDERQPQDDDVQPTSSPQPKTLSESGLRHGDVLLAWNGHTLCQQLYFTGVKRPKRLRMSVRFIRTAVDDVREFACYVGVDATLSELVSVVRRKAGWDGEVQMYVMTKRALTAVDMTLGSVKLIDLDITEHFPIVVEPTMPSSANLAHSYFVSQSSRVKLVVRDLISPPGSHANLPSHLTTSAQSSKPLPPTDFILFLDKSTTLSNLRQLLLSQLPPNFPPPSHSRLRRMTGNDRVGGVLADEGLTLLTAELDDDDVMVRLEEGQLPVGGKELDLVVSFILEDGLAVGGSSEEGETVLDQQPLMFERRWTIKQCKRHILDSCAMPRKESDFLLYRGDAAGVSKDKLLANEYITLDKLNLHHGDTLFLHVGELPIQGKVTLDVFMYTPSLLYAMKPATQSLRQLRHRYEYGEEAKEEDGGIELPVLPAVVTVPIEDGSPATTADISTRSSLLAHLVTMDFSSAATLADLKQALYSIAPLSSLPSPAHIRIRTLTKSDELHAPLADDNGTLKRQGVSNDKRLAVQMLPREERNVVSSALLLRTTVVVPKHAAADGKAGDVELLPAAAWVELLFSERLHPQVADINRWAARQCGLDGEQQVVVAKWNTADRRWRVLMEDADKAAQREEKVADSVDATKATAGKGGGKQGKAVAVSSLLTPPYQLRHHDHIAILPLRLFPSLESAAAVSTTCLQWPAPVMRSVEEGGEGADERRQARKIHQREEVALTIEY